LITERDEEALKHLTDIRMEYLDRPGFRLIFEFSVWFFMAESQNSGMPFAVSASSFLGSSLVSSSSLC
jgi:nucleosome assembly protein 1-like 1